MSVRPNPEVVTRNQPEGCRGAGADARSAAEAAPPAPPPTSNTGVNNKKGRGSDERLVIEGGTVKVLCAERQRSARSGVVVDYLRVTVRKDALLQAEAVSVSDDEALTRCLAFKVAGVLGFVLGEERKGRDYYEFTWTINNGFGKEVASVSGGGASQRDTFCVTLKGEACTYAAPGWEAALYAYLEPLDPRVTRVDLARDFLAGEVTIAEVVGHYQGGSFDYRNRRPSYQQHGCWMGDAQHSRTFQVGMRESGKLLRAYEKGHQFKLMDDAWLRIEVELRNVNRIVPFEALVRPADFFAGAYEFCEMVLDEKPEPERVVTGKAVGDATVRRFTSWVERVVAPSIRIIQAALPSAEWADLLTVRHINRRVPRGLAGINHREVAEGLSRWVQGLSADVPAVCAAS